MHVNCLIIGGTSGLGLSLAHSLQTQYSVYVTGRRKFTEKDINFLPLDLSETEGLTERIESLIDTLPNIDLVIYAAGFFQDGTVTDVDEKQIATMLNVGLNGAIHTIRYILKKQESINEFIAITSTSQWTPRLYEPVYTAVKAGLGAFANSISLDKRVKKTLVAGPAGMDTDFWKGTDPVAHDTSKMLKPDWVADAINNTRKENYTYKFVRILREPARVEVVETRD